MQVVQANSIFYLRVHRLLKVDAKVAVLALSNQTT